MDGVRPRRRALLALGLLPLTAACSRPPATVPTSLKPASLQALNAWLLSHQPDLEQFRARGPYAVERRDDRVVRVTRTERYICDRFLSEPAEAAPLVVLVHGHDSTKEDHTYQAIHLASWGMHCIVLQLPGEGPWVEHGKSVMRIAAAVREHPEIVDPRVDAARIVLAGHSFGGSATAIALAEGAPAAGGVLLDPAGIGREMPRYLSRIRRPVMMLGADAAVFEARDREYFYQFIRSDVAEVSIKDADHDDAQYPAEMYGLDLLTTEALQITFVAALTASAVSLALTGGLDYAWTSFGAAIASGKFIHARRKPRRQPGAGEHDGRTDRGGNA